MASISTPSAEHRIRSSPTSPPAPVLSLSSSPNAFVSSSIPPPVGDAIPQARRAVAGQLTDEAKERTKDEVDTERLTTTQPRRPPAPAGAPTPPPLEDDAADVLEAAAAYVAASVSESGLPHIADSFANSDVSASCLHDGGGSFYVTEQTDARLEGVRTMRQEQADRLGPSDGSSPGYTSGNPEGSLAEKDDLPKDSDGRDTREGEKNFPRSRHPSSSTSGAGSGGRSASDEPCPPSSSSSPSSLSSSGQPRSTSVSTPFPTATDASRAEATHPSHFPAAESSSVAGRKNVDAASHAGKVAGGETGVQQPGDSASRDSGSPVTAPRSAVTSGPASSSGGRTSSSSSLVRVSSSSSGTMSGGGGGSLGRRGDEGSLLRLFQSEYFDAYFHMYYLFHRQEPGVHEYLVNLLYVKRTDEDIIFYLPQLVQLSLVRYKSSSLHRFLLDKASKSMHLALMASWLYQSMVEDKVAGLEEPAQKMTQEVEMAVVNCKPLGGSFLHQGEGGTGGEPPFPVSRGEDARDSRRERKDHPFAVDLFRRSRIAQLIRRHQMQLHRQAFLSVGVESKGAKKPSGEVTGGAGSKAGAATHQPDIGPSLVDSRRGHVQEGGGALAEEAASVQGKDVPPEKMTGSEEGMRDAESQGAVCMPENVSAKLQSVGASEKEGESSECTSSQQTTLGQDTEDAGEKGTSGFAGAEESEGREERTKEGQETSGGGGVGELSPSSYQAADRGGEKKTKGGRAGDRFEADIFQQGIVHTSSSLEEVTTSQGRPVPSEASSTPGLLRASTGHDLPPSGVEGPVGAEAASTAKGEFESSRRMTLPTVGSIQGAPPSFLGTSPRRLQQGGGRTSVHAVPSSRGRSSGFGVAPRIPPPLKHLTGPTTVPGAKVKLPSVYGKLGNPLSLSTLQLPSLGGAWMAGVSGEEGRGVSGGEQERKGPSDGRGGEAKGCGNGVWGGLTGGMEEELQQFIMKQRRCDYFNTLNHFISLLIDVSTALALEPDRSLRLVLLSHFLESLNSWILCRRLYVAAMMGNSTMTGVTIPFHEVGSDVAVAEESGCLKPGTRSSSSSALSSSSSAYATPLPRRGAASSSCLTSGPSSSCGVVSSSSSKPTCVLSPPANGGRGSSAKGGSAREHSHSLQILRVDLKECRALSSKKRVPYLLVFEVADLDEDLYQFDDLDSLSFYPPLMACHPTSTSGQQYSHYAFPAFNSHSVRSSSPSLGSRQEHWDKRSDQPLSSRKHVAERRRPSSLGGTARTSSSVPPSGSTAGSGGGDSRLASARVRTAETEDERHAEVPPVLPLLDWKSFYVYDCIVDELKQQGLFVPPEDGKDDDSLSAIRRSLGLQPLTDGGVPSSKGSAPSSNCGAARRPSSASPRSRGACSSPGYPSSSSPSPSPVKHSSASSSPATERDDVSASGASSNFSLSGSNPSVVAESFDSSLPHPPSSSSLVSTSLSPQSCSPPQVRTSADCQATGLGHPGGEGSVVSGEYVGQAGAVEGSAASGGSVGGGRQRDEGEVKASPPVAGSSGGVVGNARAGEQTGGGNERLFKVKPEERADTTGQQAHGSKMKRHLWGELWSDKRERLRRRSPYGHLKSWDIRCVLVKGGDDLRQELLAGQLVRQFKAIFDEARLPLWLRPYEILVTGSSSGVMEFVPDTCSVDVLKKRHNTDSIARVFDVLFANNPFEAKKNFIESHAAYSLVSYFLQVKDRHNGNLLLDSEGHLIHIDYGYLLSNSPGNINFETSPFKLTQEFLDVMDGETSDNYEYFRTLIIRGFLEARKHADRIILLVEMMLSATKMPCFSGGPQYTLDALRDRFMIGLPEDTCIERIVDLIETSVNNFRTVQYDNFQRITNGIL